MMVGMKEKELSLHSTSRPFSTLVRKGRNAYVKKEVLDPAFLPVCVPRLRDW